MARISLQCHVLGDAHPHMVLRLHVDPCFFGKAPSAACTTSITPFALPLRHVAVLKQAHRRNPARFDQWRSKRPSPRLYGGSQHVARPTPRRGLVSAALILRVGQVSVPIMDSFRWFTSAHAGLPCFVSLVPISEIRSHRLHNCGVCDRRVESPPLPTHRSGRTARLRGEPSIETLPNATCAGCLMKRFQHQSPKRHSGSDVVCVQSAAAALSRTKR